jgi:hypothetical protein
MALLKALEQSAGDQVFRVLIPAPFAWGQNLPLLLLSLVSMPRILAPPAPMPAQLQAQLQELPA